MKKVGQELSTGIDSFFVGTVSINGWGGREKKEKKGGV